MPQHNHDSIPIATIVDSEEHASHQRDGGSAGCIIAIIAVSVGTFFLLVGGIFLLAWIAFNATHDHLARDILTNLSLPESSFVAKPHTDFEDAKEAFESQDVVEKHPQYEQFVIFFWQLKNTLEPSPNEVKPSNTAQLASLIAFNQATQRILGELQVSSSPHSFSSRLNIQLRRVPQLLAPDPFDNFKLIHIEEIAENEYRVYLETSIGYQGTEPFVFWLVRQDGRLKLYDYSQLELGLRNSTERAILLSCSPTERMNFNDYAQASQDYLNVASDNTLSLREQTAQIRSLLDKCESYAGPATLHPSVTLITARRFITEGHKQHAFNLLKTIPNPDRTPGVWRELGTLERHCQNDEQAKRYFEQYRAILGPTQSVSNMLLDCYRDLGETEKERTFAETLIAIPHFTSSLLSKEGRDSVSEYSLFGNQTTSLWIRLMELNQHTNNLVLCFAIDPRPDAIKIYDEALDHFEDAPWYSSVQTMLKTLVPKYWPNSAPAIRIKLMEDPATWDVPNLLRQIDHLPAEDATNLRYQFWNQIAEDQIVSAFKQSKHPEKDFSSLQEVWEYERDISADVTIALCQAELARNPNNFSARLWMAQTLMGQKNYSQVIKTLTQASDHDAAPSKDSMPQVQRMLMEASLLDGDLEQAISLAKKHDQIADLLQLAYAQKEKPDAEKLKPLLDAFETGTDESLYQQGLFDLHYGDAEKGIESFTLLAKQVDPNAPYSNLTQQMAERAIFDYYKKRGELVKAVERVPTPTMWSRVIHELTENFKWNECNAILRSPKIDESIFTTQLQLEMAWQGGDDKNVVRLSEIYFNENDSEPSDELIERAVRAALRLGEVVKADHFSRMAGPTPTNSLGQILIAQRQQRTSETLEKAAWLSEYQRTRLLKDPDFAWSPELRKSWFSRFHPVDLFDLIFDSSGNELELLYQESPQLDAQQLKSIFGDILHGKTTVEPIEMPSQWISRHPNQNVQRWLITSDNWSFVVEQQAIHPSHLSEALEADLKKALSESTYQVRIIRKPIKPTCPHTDYQLMMALIEVFPQKDLNAIGENDFWVTTKQVEPYRANLPVPAPTDKGRLFGFGDTPDQYATWDEGDTDPSSEKESDQFDRKFIVTYQSLQAATPDPPPFPIIFLGCNSLPVVAKIERVARTPYGPVQWIATVEKSFYPVSILQKGDKVAIPLNHIESYYPPRIKPHPYHPPLPQPSKTQHQPPEN